MSAEAASPRASGAPSASELEALKPHLVELHVASERSEFIRQHPALVHQDAVIWLKDAVLREVRINPRHAMALAEICLAIAEETKDSEALAHGLRAKANALYGIGEHRSALDHHRRAAELYKSVGNQDEVARTLSASIQPHLLLGEYDEALGSAEEAKRIFEALGNHWRIARLDINLGNIYHRQDRFAEALACYERAYRAFLTHFDAEGTAAALSNIATCQITLNDFQSALSTYQRARAFCERHGMTVLVAQADYNIAWLYFLRGEYGQAIQMLRAARERCRNQDKYHFALCHMDLSEIYLDLNLSQDAAETAREGAALFEELGMGYEHAKCIANLATALGQQEQTFAALELFAKAREIFVREKNQVWPSLIDLYQALLLWNEGRLFEARRLCATALEFFAGSSLKGKAVLAHLLMSRLQFKSGLSDGAVSQCLAALNLVDQLDTPKLSYEANLQMGELLMAAGRNEEARESLKTAQQNLESLRGSLHNQELKIAFMGHRLAVYEHLIELCLKDGRNQTSLEQAFHYVEQSKSRALMDLLFQSAPAMAPAEGHSQLAQNIRELREELNWYYHRIEQEQLNQEERSPERIQKLQTQLRERESDFLRVLRELPSDEVEGTPLQPPRPLSLEEIRESLPEGATLLEYFEIKDQIFALLFDGSELKIFPITLRSRLAGLLRQLQFQISKFDYGEEYAQRFAAPLLAAAQGHLRELYKELIAPLERSISGDRLIVVPHGLLHHVPFHAFYDGTNYLTDRFRCSYAPSASIFAMCRRRQVNANGPAAVFGVPDERAPHIRDEVKAVADLLPGSRVFLDDDASISKLREVSRDVRLLHIATHGFFRQDNPMFSGLRMADAQLSLYDLYHLKLPCDLVTLSGCATGLNVVAAGDELLGLVRGLLHAGAKSLLLSLWNVHDRSATELMTLFYSRLAQARSKTEALHHAMSELRARYSHPYYWAAFKIVGAN